MKNKSTRIQVLFEDQRGTDNHYDGKCDYCEKIRDVRVHWGQGEGLILCKDCLEVRKTEESDFMNSFGDRNTQDE